MDIYSTLFFIVLNILYFYWTFITSKTLFYKKTNHFAWQYFWLGVENLKVKRSKRKLFNIWQNYFCMEMSIFSLIFYLPWEHEPVKTYKQTKLFNPYNVFQILYGESRHSISLGFLVIHGRKSYFRKKIYKTFRNKFS